jgi:RNA polymerase sigma factor (sigma-70 family)
LSAVSDSDLVARCIAGEEQAWRDLTERYADLVYGIARRAGLADAEAGDVVQEVFLSLLKHLARIEDPRRLPGWLLQTARRESWRQRRRARSAAARERQAAQPESAEDLLPAEVLASHERRQAVRAAFRALGERCRRLLDALFYGGPGRPYAAIAEELGMPVGSIGPTRRRCLTALGEELERLGFGPPDVSGGGGGASGGVAGGQP